MAGARYITGTNHADTLVVALDAYHRALTRRWREEVANAIGLNIRSGIPAGAAVWDYSSPAARAHVGGGSLQNYAFGPSIGFCRYLMWVRNGHGGSLATVACEGWTGPDSHLHNLEPYIGCGVGNILEQVADWAYDERQAILAELPLFDAHDVSALEAAHDAFVEIGGRLGLAAAAGSEPGVLVNFPDVVETRPIPELVVEVADERRENSHWWAGWTGLAANRAADGFFASVMPTMYNQAGIAGSLANLYAYRAAIIEKGRNDALYWIQWATGSLDQTELATIDLRDGWKAVQAVGLGIQATLGWTGQGAVAGATVSLIGFLGEHVFPDTHREEYTHGLSEVIAGLREKIGLLDIALGHMEDTYATGARDLQGILYRTQTYNLELYDLTENSPDGDRGPGETGFVANVASILGIAQRCYKLGELYAELPPAIEATAAADPHLADQDGRQRVSDQRVMEIRGLLESFLKTACGRYLVAADQTRDAAEAYAAEDDTQRAAFEQIMADWEGLRVGEYDVGFDPAEYAQETERRGTGTLDDSRDYVVEGDGS